MLRRKFVFVAVVGLGCGGGNDDGSGPSVDAGDSETDAQSSNDPDAAPTLAPRFTVVTFNTGTTDGLSHDSDGDGYGDEQVQLSDQHYGNGLAWVDAIDQVTTWFATVSPEVVVFQEIFYSGDCAQIPASAHAGFICETWSPGDPTVAQLLLGDYQVACHPGKSDKCMAVKKSFGSIAQCSDPDFCLEGLDGERVNDCGGGARVARGTVRLVNGEQITIVNVHGTSGVGLEDQDCRAKQVEQIFVDMDGQPGTNGTRHVVLGDLNVDPARVPGAFDQSVRAWNQFVGGNQPFQWISDIGSSATPTYNDLLNIDHVVSDSFTGSCTTPGVGGDPAVYDNVLFDHIPIVCEIGDL